MARVRRKERLESGMRRSTSHVEEFLTCMLEWLRLDHQDQMVMQTRRSDFATDTSIEAETEMKDPHVVGLSIRRIM